MTTCVNDKDKRKTLASFIAVIRSLDPINIDHKPVFGMSLWRFLNMGSIFVSIKDNLKFLFTNLSVCNYAPQRQATMYIKATQLIYFRRA